MAIEYDSADELYDDLKDKYSEDKGWVIMREVADSTGTNASRWGDAIAMNCWPSRGLEIHGFEIKVNRGDWLSELKEPEKARAIAKYCDRFWVVAGSRDIVEEEELPKGWGLIQPHGKSLRKDVKAPIIDCQDPDRGFLASILRNAFEHSSEAKIEEAYEEGYNEGKREGIDIGKSRIDLNSKAREYKIELEKKEEKINNFVEKTGIPLNEAGRYYDFPFNAEELADAVRIIADEMDNFNDNYRSPTSRIDNAKEKVKKVKKSLEDVSEAIEDAIEPIVDPELPLDKI